VQSAINKLLMEYIAMDKQLASVLRLLHSLARSEVETNSVARKQLRLHASHSKKLMLTSFLLSYHLEGHHHSSSVPSYVYS